jgi:GT2 family glycosyltransferase
MCVMVTPVPTTVSLVVITRDRPRDLEVCLTAISASTFRDFELVVVDQSRAPDSAAIVHNFARSDPRIRVIRDEGTGAARARNIGAAATHGDIVVFTDDDCEPDPTWLARLVATLRNDPTAGLAYGAVIPAPHDPRDGFIVGFRPTESRRLFGRLAKLRDNGISANVAIRRRALEATGGFDEMLGPGAYFPCAEDYDLAYRVLAKGFAVLHVPDARTIHHGLRDWKSGSLLVQRTYMAIGAAYMKHVRLCDPVGLLLLLQEFLRTFVNVAANLASGKRPVGFGRLRGLLIGARRSFELGVERGGTRAVYRRSTDERASEATSTRCEAPPCPSPKRRTVGTLLSSGRPSGPHGRT